ncbi:MAG: AI-2E family transporter [Alphaproteobacteria bacterium]|nr:AI-2E family transporter [Alphaproteobacteria bacterium]
MNDPRATIAAWLPHAVMLTALGLAVWLCMRVLAPLWESILLGVAVAVLTYPVLFEPLDHLTRTWRMPFGDSTRRTVLGVVATALLVLMLVSPGVLAVIGAIGDLRQGVDIFVGVALRDEEQIARLAQIVVDQAARLQAEYSLPIDPENVRVTLLQALDEAGNFAPTFLSFLFKGTGSVIAQYILSLVVSTFCYANAPELIDRMLAFSPLNREQATLFRRTHRAAILRLLYDTVALALAKGFVFGGVMYGFARFYDLAFFDNYVLTSLLSAFIALVPAVGVTVVWVPLALVLWNNGQTGALGLLVALVYGTNFVLDGLHRRIGRRLQRRSHWEGMFLFLSLIGGVLGFGLKGLIVGPTAVVLTAVLGSFWLPLYGIRGWEDEEGEVAGPAA